MVAPSTEPTIPNAADCAEAKARVGAWTGKWRAGSSKGGRTCSMQGSSMAISVGDADATCENEKIQYAKQLMSHKAFRSVSSL